MSLKTLGSLYSKANVAKELRVSLQKGFLVQPTQTQKQKKRTLIPAPSLYSSPRKPPGCLRMLDSQTAAIFLTPHINHEWQVGSHYIYLPSLALHQAQKGILLNWVMLGA